MAILVSVYDKKAAEYWSPQPFESIAECLRAYAMAVSRGDRKGPLQNFPEDFDLYHVGDFDKVSGSVAVCTPPMFLESLINIAAISKPREGV